MRALAVIAHDNRKADLVAWAAFNRECLNRFRLLPTRSFFFVDPLSAQPHDPDIRALLRVCTLHNVPLATNVATADLIVATLGGAHAQPASGRAMPD